MHDTEKIIVDSPQTSKPKPQARVSFADTQDVTFVANLKHEFKPKLWFSRTEMQLMWRDMTPLVREIIANNITIAQYAVMNAHDMSALMGLETYLIESSPGNIALRRWAVWDMVLSEQESQWQVSMYDPYEMASLSEAQTGLSARQARAIGKLHASKNM